MRKLTRRTAAAAAALALAIAVPTAVGATGAYFTTYASAVGTVPLTLDQKTTIEEDFVDWTKQLNIINDATGSYVWVRAKAFGPSEYPLIYSEPNNASNWTPGDDGYYYYAMPLAPGAAATQLNVQIQNVPGAKDANGNPSPSAPNPGDNFNVVVIYETTPASFDADGNALEADWNIILEKQPATPEGGDE